MDIPSTAQLLGNFGEFIGAIAVVITLVYLAVQVRLGKKSLDASTQLIQRGYDLQVSDTQKLISESVSEHLRPMVQDAELAQIWLDGISGKDLSEVDQFRFRAMCHESIWQEATMHDRMLILGRPELARAQEEAFASKIRSQPGFKTCWERNLIGLRQWGYEDLIQAVNAIE